MHLNVTDKMKGKSMNITVVADELIGRSSDEKETSRNILK